jgi:hypothetical protein
VPHTVYRALLTAIELRDECSAWFEQQQHCVDNGDPKRTNATHAFFNSILETIRQLLESCAEPTPLRQPPSTDSASATSTINNIYDALSRISLSDSEDSEDDEPFRQPPDSAANTLQAPAVVFETDKSGDVLMAIYCLLQDFLEIRLTVRSNWHMFVDDSGPKGDLFMAAVVTQGANELIHILVKDFCRPWGLPHGPVLFAPGSTACLLSRTSPLGLVRAPFST